MITRRCLTTCRQVANAQSAEVAAALAQLPAFLVPSFSQPPPAQPQTVESRRTYTSVRSRPSLSYRQSSNSHSNRQPFLSRSALDHRNQYSTAAARSVRAIEQDYQVSEEDKSEIIATESSTDRKGKGKATSTGQGDTSDNDQKEPAPVTTQQQRAKRTPRKQDPEVRKQLLQLLADLPPKPTRNQLLKVRKRIKDHDRLDDPRLTRKIVSIAIDQQFYGDALRLLHESTQFMLSLGRDLDRDASWMYVDTVQHLGRLRRWELVVEASDQALEKGLVSPLLLHQRMRGLNKRSRYKDTIATFELYEKHDIPRDGKAYDEVIEAHLLDGDLPKAQAVLAEKGMKGFPTTVQTCLMLCDGMALYGGNKVMEEKVLAEVEEQDLESRLAVRQDVRVLNKIMSVRAGRDAARDALAMLDYYNLERYPAELFDKLRQLSIPSDNPDPPSSPLKLDHWRPAPDRATIVTLVGLALRYRRPDLASDLLSSTTARSHQLNDHMSSSIVRTLITEGSISDAEEFVFSLPLGQAKFRGYTYPPFKPGSFVYESLLTGILRFRGLAGVNDCFRRLTEAKLPPLKVTEGLTRALLDYLALEKMRKLGLSTNLLVKVDEITAGRTKPTRENLNTLLKAAWMSERLSLNDWTKLRKSYENEFPIPAEEDGMKPPQRPLPQIAQLLAPQKLETNGQPLPPSSIVRVRDSLLDRNIRHDPKTAVHILRNDHLIRFISAKWDYLQAQVLDLGVRPTYDHFTVLIRAYLKLGDVKGAVLALRYALQEAKIDPHVALYSTMISGLSRIGRHDLALTMYEELRGTPGVEPDRQLFAALAMSCSRMRDLEGVERIFEEVKNHVNNPLPGKIVDPGLLEQAQIQSKARRKTAKSEEEVKFWTLSYDPLLDPVFLTIYYRTLNMLGRHHEAQIVMQTSLERGMVPDRIVWEVLDRTGAWLRWKHNKEQKDSVQVDRSQTKQVWEENFRKVRKMVKTSQPKNRGAELAAIETYWEKAERGDVDDQEWADFFSYNSHRRKEYQRQSEAELSTLYRHSQ
ncbi:hypothetical protein JCM5350_000516 [Sporobolomyces pararoseus]